MRGHVRPPSSERRSMRAPRAAGEEGEAKKSFVPSEAMEPWQPRGGDSGSLASRDGGPKLLPPSVEYCSARIRCTERSRG